MRTRRSLNRDYARNLGDSFLQPPLDAVLKRDRSTWTADARTEETDLNDAIFGDSDELDVAAIRLNRWAHQFDDRTGAFFQRAALVACF